MDRVKNQVYIYIHTSFKRPFPIILYRERGGEAHTRLKILILHTCSSPARQFPSTESLVARTVKRVGRESIANRSMRVNAAPRIVSLGT